MTAKTAESIRIEARLIRPGHTVRLEYGRRLNLAVEHVSVEPEWVRLDGPLSYPGCDPHTYAENTKHSHTTRMRVVADRNQPPARLNDGWNGPVRLIRQWVDDEATVWSLNDPDEPMGHGGRLRGHLAMVGGAWTWRAAFGDVSGAVVGNYIDAEAALLTAVPTAAPA